MALRRLELFGFKSFADHTEFEFSPGVTAVVGPNGSGKSNVVDALLWVFGERGRKILRTEQPVEVIFAGSHRRPRINLAEVTVVLDNSARWLPLDFAEVTVTRRIHRSSDSEFSINRQPCRLRDIQDLLLDTGIGQQAYSFVTQNEMDAVLSLRPEERRSLLDEAAGINRYRHRKDETIRKLEDTERNLTRLGDLMHGIELQLETLVEQVEVAQRYQTLQQQASQLQRGLLVRDYDLLAQRGSRYREREQEAEARRTQLQAGLARWEVAEQRARLALTGAEARLDEARQALAEIGRQLERVDGARALVAERARALQQRDEERTRRRQTVRERLRQLAVEEQTWQQEGGERESQRHRLRHERQEIQRHLEALEQALQSADAEAAQRRAALVELGERRSLLRGQLQQVDALLAEWSDQEAERVHSLQERRQAEEEAERIEAAARESRERANQLLRAAEEADAAAQDALRAWGEQVRRLERVQAEEQAELSDVAGRARVLREMEARYEGFYRGVRSVLKGRDEQELTGTYAVVAEWLEVPPRYEAAVESGLGGRLQDIVTATGEEAKRGIDYLKARRAGRATFLPLDLLRPPSTSRRAADASAEPGVLGWALDLVGFPAEFEPAARSLLARLLIVEDLAVGLRVRRRFGGDFTLVSLEGDLMLPGGAMSGGSKDSQRPALLGRRREIAGLEAARDDRQRRLQATGQALDEARRSEGSAQRASQAARRSLADAQHRAADGERQWLQACSEGERRRRERQQAEEAQETWQGRRQTAQRQREQLHEQCARLEGQQQTERALADRAEDRLGERRRALQEGRERAMRLQIQLAELESADRTAQAQQQQWQTLRDEWRREEERSQEEETRLAGERQALEEERDRHERQRERLLEEQEDLEQRLAAQRKAREALLQEVSDTLERLKQGRRELHETEEQLHRLAIQRTEIAGELQHIRRELDEHHGLTLDQARAQTPEISHRARAAEELKQLQERMQALGSVNLGAMDEYERLQQQIRFYTDQRADLREARSDLLATIAEIDRQTRGQFVATLERVGREFNHLFQLLFGPQGEAEIILSEPENVLDSGLEIVVQLPGKRRQNLLLLSGGERALTAIALIFALFRVKPAPFCVLDEVDAPLDEANVARFCRLLRAFTDHTQFVLITHNKLTMEMADCLYGITMQEPGISSLLSVELTDVALPG